MDFLGCQCVKGELRHRSDCPNCAERDAEYLSAMTEGYVSCAFWTAPEDLIAPTSGEFDLSPHRSRIPAAMWAQARRVCERFYNENRADLSTYPATNAGIDLYLSRNGHGAGFWEDDYTDPPVGDRLQESARKLGEIDIYKGKGGWYGFDRAE